MPLKKLSPFFWFVIVLLTLNACISHNEETITEVHHDVIPVSDSIVVDSMVDEIIKPYRLEMDKTMNKVIGFSDQVMVKGFPEGLLGNWVCDLLVEQTKMKHDTQLDFAFTNNGGLRNIIPKDTVLLRNAYELMPFDNMVVVLTLNHHVLNKLFNYIIENKNIAVSGIRIKYLENNDRVIEINGESFDASRTYKVATIDYLANGGDHMTFLKNANENMNTGVFLRDMIIDHIVEKNENGETLKSQIDGRIEIVQ